MQDPHPDRSALSRLATGRLQGRPLLELLEHLARCPRCGSLFGGTTLAPEPQQNGKSEGPERYGRALDRAARRVARMSGRLGRERRGAAFGFANLAALPERERRRAVRAEPRLQTWAVARRALDLAVRSRTDDPRVAEELSKLALVVTETLSPRSYGRSVLEDLRSEVWAAIGNARRIRTDFRLAGTAFETARGHAEDGTGDPLEAAELASLYGTYLRDTSRLDEARHCYDTAIDLYHDVGDRHLEGRTLISKALLERRIGRFDEALRLLERAPRLVDPVREPRLVGAVRQNRAHVLWDLGEPESALAALDGIDARPELARRGRLDRLRTLWLRALLLERLGRRGEARHALLFTRRGFESARLPADVALLDLDIARFHLEDGDRDGARRLATEAFPVFVTRRLASETVRALEIFRAAGGGG